MSAANSTPAFASSTDSEKSELARWRAVGPRCIAIVEEFLAFKGDTADRDTVSLQHELAALTGALKRCALCERPIFPDQTQFTHSALGFPAWGRSGVVSHLSCAGALDRMQANPRRG